jgi:hypothetical protein
MKHKRYALAPHDRIVVLGFAVGFSVLEAAGRATRGQLKDFSVKVGHYFRTDFF